MYIMRNAQSIAYRPICVDQNNPFSASVEQVKRIDLGLDFFLTPKFK